MFPAARRLTFGLARTAQAPLTLSARRLGQARRLMSTVSAEAAVEEAPKHWARIDNPPIAWLATILGTTYLLCIRWAIKDRSLAKKFEAIEAEKAAAHVEAEPAEIAVTPATSTSVAPPMAPSPAVTAVLTAVPVNPADPTTWKVADTCAWLESQELGDHVQAFKTHAVDGKLLFSLTEQDMYSVLEIQSPLRRKKLAMAIAELRSMYLNP